MSSNTLTSLAILKVNVDHGRDYLDYLRPFILHVLAKNRPDRITDGAVKRLISQDFGLEIPEQVVEIVLRRLARSPFMKRDHGIYELTRDVPDPQISSKMADAERHIGAVVQGLIEFSKGTRIQIVNDEAAIRAICSFLSEFDITCLRSYLRGTAIPVLDDTHSTDIVLVSDYVQHLKRTAPVRFNSFIVLVQGHMLANALTCPDLRDAPKNFKNVIFYIDTPLLVRAIGADGDTLRSATIDLLDLVRNLGGKVAAFSHSREELQRVIQGAAGFLDRLDGRGAIVFEARRSGATRSDLLLLAESLDEHLSAANVEVRATPNYIERFQIDETIFERVLDDEISYYNPRAKQFDINSVRSIHVIRESSPAPSLEKRVAVLVTNNGRFARAAWEYGQQYESTRNVSSVITDFALANIAWLKEPMETPSIPTSQLLAFSYAALNPPNELLDKYLTEIDRLQEQGTITARDHQLLRSSPLVYGELMHMTLGEEAALTDETIKETLSRVAADIRKEESDRLTVEQRDHQETRNALGVQERRVREMELRLYRRCRRRAGRWAWAASSILTVLLIAGMSYGINWLSGVPVISSLMIGGAVVLGLMTLMNILFGSTVSEIHGTLKRMFCRKFIERDSNSIEGDLSRL